MKNMFTECSSLESLVFGDSFDTSHVTDMSGLFQGMEGIFELDLSKFDTSNVTDMTSMFEGAGRTGWLETLDLSSFNTCKVTRMASMFNSCETLMTIYVGTGWNTALVSDEAAGGDLGAEITGGKGTVWTNSCTDVTYAVIDTPETPGYLTKLGE